MAVDIAKRTRFEELLVDLLKKEYDRGRLTVRWPRRGEELDITAIDLMPRDQGIRINVEA